MWLPNGCNNQGEKGKRRGKRQHHSRKERKRGLQSRRKRVHACKEKTRNKKIIVYTRGINVAFWCGRDLGLQKTVPSASLLNNQIRSMSAPLRTELKHNNSMYVPYINDLNSTWIHKFRLLIFLFEQTDVHQMLQMCSRHFPSDPFHDLLI